jgi:hypothetical protein
MALKRSISLAIGAVVVALTIGGLTTLPAQQAGCGGGGLGQTFFTAADANKDGFLTRDELRAAVVGWLAQGDTAKTGSLTENQLSTVRHVEYAPVGFAVNRPRRTDLRHRDHARAPHRRYPVRSQRPGSLRD